MTTRARADSDCFIASPSFSRSDRGFAGAFAAWFWFLQLGEFQLRRLFNNVPKHSTGGPALSRLVAHPQLGILGGHDGGEVVSGFDAQGRKFRDVQVAGPFVLVFDQQPARPGRLLAPSPVAPRAN